MARRNEDEQLFPYWIQLVKDVHRPARDDDPMRVLLYLDLRAAGRDGQMMVRASWERLLRCFVWFTGLHKVGNVHMNEYALMITPLDPELDWHMVDDRPRDWAERAGRPFLWFPISLDDDGGRYPWQR